MLLAKIAPATASLGVLGLARRHQAVARGPRTMLVVAVQDARTPRAVILHVLQLFWVTWGAQLSPAPKPTIMRCSEQGILLQVALTFTAPLKPALLSSSKASLKVGAAQMHRLRMMLMAEPILVQLSQR